MKTLLEVLKESLGRSSWYGILLAFFLFFFAQLILVGLVAPLLGMAYGIGQPDTIKILGGEFGDNEQAHAFFRSIQFLNQVCVWALPAWLLAGLLGPRREVLSLESPRPMWLPLLAGLTMIASLPLVQWTYLPEKFLNLPEKWSMLEEWMRNQEQIGQETLMSLIRSPGVGILMINLLVFALAPALCEELFFRGFLLRQVRSHLSMHGAVWLVAALFSLVHFQMLGFFSRLFLGGLLGYFVVYGGSLWSSVVAHFVFNATAILAEALRKEETQSLDLGDERPVWYLALLSAGFTLLLLTQFWRSAQRFSPDSE